LNAKPYHSSLRSPASYLYQNSPFLVEENCDDLSTAGDTLFMVKYCPMMKSRAGIPIRIGITVGMIFVFVAEASAQRQMEKLGRGVVAVNQSDGKVYIGWRLLGTDPDDIAFNVYRNNARVNSQPITESTNLVDDNPDPVGGATPIRIGVRAVINGSEGKPSAPARVWSQNYLSIPLATPDGYTPNDASVGDLDGDGEYEIVLHQTGRGRDNAQGGMTDPPILEAYKLDGTFLWRINLGKNIREGAHYTQFMVYDLDGDGKAEVACKTADGTIDGKGKVIGDPNADYRSSRGYILDGPEFLTIFDGKTGAELVTTDYIPPRGNVTDWGDDYGNRVDRFLACIAYLDGQRPSLVMCRGYYTRAVLAAWNYRDGKLTHVWTFDSDDGTAGNRDYRGQGNHNLAVGDVDGDSKDEIIYGACAIDHDGKGLYSTGLGHGDAMHLSDIDPDRPGLEVFAIHERPPHPYGANLRDAATGKVIWGLQLKDPGRGVSLDIDPRHRGYECWANNSAGLYNCRGEKISDAKPRSCNMGIWWDGDVLRELLDGVTIDKWDYASATATRLFSAEGCARNNGTKSNPCLAADILGDWREELICRTSDGRELRIFTTTILTNRRFYTFMHDPVYRLSVAWQNVAYNQPTQPGFYMGDGMASPPRPSIGTPGNVDSD
jgi:rhamnogalacturonan endolyase